jgi:hypothetical protein
MIEILIKPYKCLTLLVLGIAILFMSVSSALAVVGVCPAPPAPPLADDCGLRVISYDGTKIYHMLSGTPGLKYTDPNDSTTTKSCQIIAGGPAPTGIFVRLGAVTAEMQATCYDACVGNFTGPTGTCGVDTCGGRNAVFNTCVSTNPCNICNDNNRCVTNTQLSGKTVPSGAGTVTCP